VSLGEKGASGNRVGASESQKKNKKRTRLKPRGPRGRYTKVRATDRPSQKSCGSEEPRKKGGGNASLFKKLTTAGPVGASGKIKTACRATPKKERCRIGKKEVEKEERSPWVPLGLYLIAGRKRAKKEGRQGGTQ